MTLNERKLLSPVSINQVFSSHLTDTQDCTLYNDTKLICKDGTIFSSRLLLSLAFPFLERPLACLEKMVEPVIILPDFGADELVRNIQTFLSETESKDCAKKDDHVKTETVEEIIVIPKVEFEELNDDRECLSLDRECLSPDGECLSLDGECLSLDGECPSLE